MKTKATYKRSTLLLVLCYIYVTCLDTANASSRKKCITATGTEGSCMTLSDCPSMRDNIIFPIAEVGAALTSVCPIGFLRFELCCPQPKANNYLGFTTESTNSVTETPKEASSTACETPEEGSSAVYQPLQPPQCGYSMAIHNRVVGGTPAEEDAWPWMAAIAIRYGEKNESVEFMCGGSLITSRHVLTAAHCMDFEDTPYLVRLGELDLKLDEEAAKPSDYGVEKITIHPKYVEASKQNDIAIIRLDREVEFNNAVHPICLPVIKELRDRDFVRSYPFVAGWGATSYQGNSSSILLETQVPVVTNAQCKKAYASKKNAVIDERVLCAGYAKGGKDTCQGDSGGPLMFPYKMNYYLIGIVSNGFRCAKAGYPGIYTRVTHFLDYILANLD